MSTKHIRTNMNLSAVFVIICFFSCQLATGQFYYKELLVPARTTQQLLDFKKQRIKSVKILSYERDSQPTEGFEGSQTIHNNYTKIVTRFISPYAGESMLTSFFNTKGQLVSTLDTTDGSGSLNRYSYNVKDQLTSIVNISTSDGPSKQNEAHLWHYRDDGSPDRLLRIKNERDTSYYEFILDEKGRVAEENGRRNSTSLPSFYYYYNDQGQLTDIASYSRKADRILPGYIFEYNNNGLVSSMIMVPEGSDDYQKWHYTYNDAGLKIKEQCFNKKRQLLGSIEYQYD